MHQLSFSARQEHLPAIEPVLLQCGTGAITLRDAAGEPLMEPAPGETPLWSELRISALFFSGKALDIAQTALHEILAVARLPALCIETLPDRDWERTWLADLKPMRYGGRLWVCPGDYAIEDPTAAVVRLDPGLAFGTGAHPTTALCLEWLEGAPLQNRRVLDYGCGSGILALAALKLGAREAWAVDIDPQALQATRANAGRNGIEPHRLHVLHPARLRAVQADIVIANILALTLVESAPALAGFTAPHGRIALAGILTSRAEGLNAVYSEWFEMRAADIRGDWALAAGRRKA